MKGKNTFNFFAPKKENGIGQWLAEEGISAGFPSPADDFKEIRISLDKELVKNKEATFYSNGRGFPKLDKLYKVLLKIWRVCILFCFNFRTQFACQ